MSTVVLAVHYQNDVVHPEGKIRAGLSDAGRVALVRNASRLLRGARGRDVAVVSVRIAFRPGHRGVVQSSPMFAAAVKSGALVDGTWGAEFHPRLGPRRGEIVVSHSRINAFHGSDLELVLSSLDASRLVIAGVATHSAVEHTARHAADCGYEVVVARDACASADPELHAASLRNLELHVACVTTVDDALAHLGAAHG